MWSKKIKAKTHGSYENVIDLLGHNNCDQLLISVFSLTGWDSITSFLIQSQIKIRQNQRIPVPDSTFHIDRKVFYYKMYITTKQVQLFFKHKNETGSSIASNLLILALFPSWHYYHHHNCGFQSNQNAPSTITLIVIIIIIITILFTLILEWWLSQVLPPGLVQMWG